MAVALVEEERHRPHPHHRKFDAHLLFVSVVSLRVGALAFFVCWYMLERVLCFCNDGKDTLLSAGSLKSLSRGLSSPLRGRFVFVSDVFVTEPICTVSIASATF